MTLVVTVNGPETIWLMTDRSLYFEARALRDDARKVMFLETTDGVAILGYAGLGANASGTEPADWLSSVFRGRNLPLEQSLGVLADAMKRQLPRHLTRIPGQDGPAHKVLITAFVGDEVRLYTIDLAFAPDRKSYRFRYTRHVVDNSSPDAPRTPRLSIAGSGALYLMHDKKWIRKLLRVVKANDCGQLSANTVAAHLAILNNEVYFGVRDGSVGPRCIVAWRHRKNGVHKGRGGYQSYTGAERDAISPSLPTIANGMNVSTLAKVMMPRTMKMFEAMRGGEPAKDLDKDEINAELARLPDKPDETLR
ncbi:hypothetical protein HZB60_09865 [candidate division KSB1 bacterium]|nr:hypothetical protein [candidate division KSB1 bacterium]